MAEKGTLGWVSAERAHNPLQSATSRLIASPRLHGTLKATTITRMWDSVRMPPHLLWGYCRGPASYTIASSIARRRWTRLGNRQHDAGLLQARKQGGSYKKTHQTLQNYVLTKTFRLFKCDNRILQLHRSQTKTYAKSIHPSVTHTGDLYSGQHILGSTGHNYGGTQFIQYLGTRIRFFKVIITIIIIMASGVCDISGIV